MAVNTNVAFVAQGTMWSGRTLLLFLGNILSSSSGQVEATLFLQNIAKFLPV
jgi:hypothetical protein